ncbi:hypothetical protein ACFQ1B_33355 [Streptomyces mexicanus]
MSRTATSSRGRRATPGSPRARRSRTWWKAAVVTMEEISAVEARQIVA